MSRRSLITLPGEIPSSNGGYFAQSSSAEIGFGFNDDDDDLLMTEDDNGYACICTFSHTTYLYYFMFDNK